jgi:transposase-like protein
MTSPNSKYTEAIRERTENYIIESNKSATRVGEELGIDKNTICRWVREYRSKNRLPSYQEEQDIRGKTARETKAYMMKEDKKRIEILTEEVEILKKALHIFMPAPK